MPIVFIPGDALRGLPPGASAKNAVTMLMEMVRDKELTPEEAMRCVRFEPEPEADDEQPLRFTISGMDGFLLMLRMVRDGIHPVETVVSCCGFSETA
jgi:hypothetical protein